MYRILIADDEEMVRDLLAKNIGRLALDVEVAAVASDGREAFELATRLKPDIVITDIAMPFLNGLELIRKMRENGIESKNIIISGYDEFDYARQAIALGVQNYLLKPFLPKDIKNELEKMIHELDSQKALAQNMEMLASIAESRSALMRETVLKDILEGSQEKTELWKESEIPQDASWYTAGILKTDQNSWDFSSQKKVEEFLEMIRDRYFSTELSMYAVSFDRKSIALLWCAKKGELAAAQRQIVEGLQHVQRSLKKYYQIRLTVALGSPYPVIEQTADSYREAKSVWRGMVNAQEGIRVYSEETEKLKQPDFENETKNQIRFWKNQIRLCVRTGQKQEALVNLTGLIKSYAALADKKNDYICASVAELIYDMQNDMEKAGIQREYRQTTELTQSRLRYGSLADMKELMEEFIETYCEIVSRQSEETKAENVTAQIRALIDGNLGYARMDQEWIASQVHFSTSYIRQIFKQVMKENISEYIIRKRMELAGNLLKNTSFKVQEIAQECGYEDQRYFASSFKKFYGCTPTEYKRIVEE